MKKILLQFALFAGFAFGASAQCIVDTAGLAGSNIYPDTLNCIIQNQSFSGTVSIKVPDSLDVHDFISSIPAGYVKALIDSIQITSISGMPTGITQASNPANGSWIKANHYACATFSGTTSAPAGSYPLTITGSGCGHFTVAGTTYDSCFQSYNFSSTYPYALKVCTGTGISEASPAAWVSVYPNPGNGSFYVNISAAELNGSMSVSDALGRVVYSQSVDVNGSKQFSLNLSGVAAGAYLLAITGGNVKVLKQIVIR